MNKLTNIFVHKENYNYILKTIDKITKYHLNPAAAACTTLNLEKFTTYLKLSLKKLINSNNNKTEINL